MEITQVKVVTTIPEMVEKAGMNTATFAKRSGLTYNQALAIRRGVWTRIDLATLAKVASALGVEPGDLFKWENEDEQGK